jgi:hypothetical protein
LRRFENIPKYKPPGINIDIQGKQKNKYKMRISGARNKYQLNKIIDFMNILIYLYIETYLRKNPLMVKLKEKLKLLTNIAKRRNRVEEIVDIIEDVKSVKQITKLDKERLGFKPEKGQNQWTRNCQNSGDDKKRRPIPYTDKTIDELIKQGYVFNPKSGDYERTITVSKKGKSKEIVLRAAKLTNNDGTNVYYTCGPEENGTHQYVGFLAKSNNPNGLCMPCCFKKDHYVTRNKEKKDYYMKCTGKFKESDKVSKKILTEKLYVLQDTNKMQDGRFGYLPIYLDIYFNNMLNKTKFIRNHYLISSKTGYFFKYGSRNDEYPYLNAIVSATDLSISDIKDKIKQILTSPNNDKNLEIFTSLNNGDIRTQFETIENYLYYLNVNFEIDYPTIEDILCIPDVLFEYGANIFIFEKIKTFDNENSEDNSFKEDYVLLCKNTENIDLIFDKKRKNIILLKEDTNYYPIFMTIKEEHSKSVELVKVFNYEDTPDNIINHISIYFNLDCAKSTINFFKSDNAKISYNKINEINNDDLKVSGQIIDQRNKCKYLILNSGLLPVKPSGTIWHLPITMNINQYLLTLEQSIKHLMNIYDLSVTNKTEIYCKVQGFIYDKQNDKEYNIIAIIIDQTINLPVQEQYIKYDELQKISNKYGIKHFIMESRSLYDVIDNEIIKGSSNQIVDQRVLDVKKNMFEQESYELFRLEFSNFLNDHIDIKNKIEHILLNEKISKNDKKPMIKKIIYKFTDKSLYKLYTENISSDLKGGNTDVSNNMIKNILKSDVVQNNFINIIPDDEITDDIIVHYKINNNRDLCKINSYAKAKCDSNIHCSYVDNSCKFSLKKSTLVLFINKIVEELTSNELKSNELLQKDTYFVSDIVNIDRFKERKHQKIIKSVNVNIKKILGEIFGKNNIPQIGKSLNNRLSKNIVQDIQLHTLDRVGNMYLQLVNSSMATFRAYVNCFYWLKNIYSDLSYRNLGFYNVLQTDLSNLFKSFIIDYLLNRKRTNKMINDLQNIIKLNDTDVDEYLQYFIKSNISKYCSIIDYYILNQLHHIPIILYDIYDQPFVIIDNGIKYAKFSSNHNNNNILNEYSKEQYNYINIKLSILNPNLTSTVTNVYALYFTKK